MRLPTFIGVMALLAAAIACTAPGAAETPQMVTVEVTSDSPTVQPTSTNTPQPVQGITCKVVRDVRVHSCTGPTAASAVGGSPAGSSFVPASWDGQSWYYGQIPTTSGPKWGWVSGLNTDGSPLVSCTGDMSALPKGYDPCPTATPTATWTPTPTDTPTATATATTSSTATPSPTATYNPLLCGNGTADKGETCGEPQLQCGGLQICVGCQCITSTCGDGVCAGREDHTFCPEDCP